MIRVELSRDAQGSVTALAPMTWDADGWPVIGNNGTIAPVMEMDTLPIHAWPKPPARDDFDAPALDFRWIMLRMPVGDRFYLATRPSWLTIRATAGPSIRSTTRRSSPAVRRTGTAPSAWPSRLSLSRQATRLV